MKTLIKKALNRFGFEVVLNALPDDADLKAFPDLSKDERRIVTTVKPFTMTSIERIVCLMNAVIYITGNKIESDIAECGVWRGGSMMTVALTPHSRGDTSRNLYLTESKFNE